MPSKHFALLKAEMRGVTLEKSELRGSAAYVAEGVFPLEISVGTSGEETLQWPASALILRLAALKPANLGILKLQCDGI